ncbi:MAG: DegT/DnrJ/EryC1/StrS family aminotransferase [Lachnospiraceae bacterium]|nr:DegT/DnrJ/EryC1/StrS family aminotransferase [Lachnospiraceae bacterium]
MKYGLCQSSWDEEELEAINEVIKSDMYTMGKHVAAYEQEFALRFGSKYAVMVNSGSSANLVAVASLVYSGKLQAGDEVIVPAVSWSTTYFPLAQFGLKMIFVDVDAATFNMDASKIREVLTDKTKLIVAVNLLGNANEFDALTKICEKENIILMEDNCEAMGAEYKGKQLGTIGKLGTFSTFFAHHLCTMEGGMVLTDDRELYEYMLCIRAHGWTRNLPKDSVINEANADPFYEKFNFIVPGYNVRPLDMEGAIGCRQIKKLDGIIKNRRINAAYLSEKIKELSGLRLQAEIGKSSWYGFGMILEGKYAGKRNQVVSELEKAGIETRPILAGNFTKNKAVRFMDYNIPYPLKNSDVIHESGFYIGNHPQLIHDKIDYFVERIGQILKGID